MMIAIIDYDMGNSRSVEKAIEAVGGEPVVTNELSVIEDADKIILPGVGAFSKAMENLESLKLVDVLKRQILEYRKPLLGICLGMQLLAKTSYEFQETAGLGLIDATVERFNQGLVVPHVGWNNITLKRDTPFFDRVKSGDDFYFVHSFYMKNNRLEDIAATCDYGIEFTAAVGKDNIFATQFHPEKSQEKGLNILTEFVHLAGKVNA